MSPANEKRAPRTPSRRTSAATRALKSNAPAVRSESDSDAASSKRPRRRSVRRSAIQIPVLDGGETADDTDDDKMVDVTRTPPRPLQRDTTATATEAPQTRRSPRNRPDRDNTIADNGVTPELSKPKRKPKKAAQSARKARIPREENAGVDSATLRESNPSHAVPVQRTRGKRGTDAPQTARDDGGEICTLQERVAWMRKRLYSEDTDAALPGELADALRAVSSAVVPALRGHAASAIVLLTGARGSGKTAVVRRLLHDVREGNDWEGGGGAPVVVELHGLLHGSANSAFRAIARALGGSGIGGAQLCLGEIGACVTALREAKTPLLIVLDEFHCFVHGAAASQAGQTVLYALFNLLQDSALRAAALCVTPHVDVADHLEKRVKSRFAPRAVRLRAPRDAQAVIGFLHDTLVPGGKGNDRASRAARALIASEIFTKALRRQFQRDRALGDVLAAVDASLLAPLLLAGADDNSDGNGARMATRAAVSFSNALERGGSARDFVLGLAALELALLLALARLERRGAAPLLFDDVYREYEGLATGGQASMLRTQLTHIEPRGISAKAWERVVEAGLVARAGGAAGARHVSLAVAPDVVLDALKEHPNATTLVQRWGAGSTVV